MYLNIKRVVDFFLSLFAIIVLSPVLLLIALAVKLDSRGAVLFRQKRVGKDKVLFEMFKFRTMHTKTPKDVPTHLLSNPDAYITRVGRFLRRSSLDELPQLFNILIGDMSIVAPRPALWNQGDLIAERDGYIGRYGLTANQIRPGLTGWAQVNGRDELPIAVKARFDGEYIEKISFAFDVKIVLMTIRNVIRSEGIREGGGQNL